MKSFLRDLFFKNLALKLIALVVSFLVWFYVVSMRDFEHSYFFKLQAENLDRKYIWTTDETDSVEVKLVGTGKSLLKMSNEDREILFDASDFKPDKGMVLRRRIVLSEENVVIPYDDIRVIEILNPPTKRIDIRIQMIEQRMIPITSRLVIVPSSGFLVSGKIEFTPSEVLVVGPVERFLEIDSIRTVVDTIRGLRSTTIRTVQLDDNIEDVSFKERSVMAKIPIDRLAHETFEGITVEPRDFPRDFQVMMSPGTVNVIISGSSEIVAKVQPTDIEAYIDYRQISLDGDSRLVPVITHPPNVTVSGIEPEYITVKELTELYREGLGVGR